MKFWYSILKNKREFCVDICSVSRFLASYVLSVNVSDPLPDTEYVYLLFKFIVTFNFKTDLCNCLFVDSVLWADRTFLSDVEYSIFKKKFKFVNSYLFPTSFEGQRLASLVFVVTLHDLEISYYCVVRWNNDFGCNLFGLDKTLSCGFHVVQVGSIFISKVESNGNWDGFLCGSMGVASWGQQFVVEEFKDFAVMFTRVTELIIPQDKILSFLVYSCGLHVNLYLYSNFDFKSLGRNEEIMYSIHLFKYALIRGVPSFSKGFDTLFCSYSLIAVYKYCEINKVKRMSLTVCCSLFSLHILFCLVRSLFLKFLPMRSSVVNDFLLEKFVFLFFSVMVTFNDFYKDWYLVSVSSLNKLHYSYIFSLFSDCLRSLFVDDSALHDSFIELLADFLLLFNLVDEVCSWLLYMFSCTLVNSAFGTRSYKSLYGLFDLVGFVIKRWKSVVSIVPMKLMSVLSKIQKKEIVVPESLLIVHDALFLCLKILSELPNHNFTINLSHLPLFCVSSYMYDDFTMVSCELELEWLLQLDISDKIIVKFSLFPTFKFSKPRNTWWRTFYYPPATKDTFVCLYMDILGLSTRFFSIQVKVDLYSL